MKKILFKLLPVLLLIGITVIFYWKYFLRGMIPMPGDLMIGAYLPWLDFKWGNVVGVVIKNPLISDIFSQFYIWKSEAARSLIHGIWPLWNPYSYSGFPMLASFNYGSLNPFNILLELLGKNIGWSWLVMIQTFGSSVFMFLFLKSLRRKTISALIGAVVYGFGGYAMVRSQFVNVGYALLYLPIALNLIEKTRRDNMGKRLLFIAPIMALTVMSGHFQSMVYSGILVLSYFIYRIGLKNKKLNLSFGISVILAIGMSLIQLLPTMELMSRSIRFEEVYIESINYGLLPGRNLITLLAPDFYGNPTTNNYWGFSNYHETIAYAGVIGFFALIFGIFNFNKFKSGKFFIVAAVIALLLQFDTPIGKLIYLLKVPFMWTSAAGRIDFVFLVAISVVVSEMVDRIHLLKFSEKIRLSILPIFLLIVAGSISYFCKYLFLNSGVTNLLTTNINNLSVGMRNLVIPFLLTIATATILIFSKKINFWKYAVFVIVLADLFRFGWKYIPFVPEKYIFPNTEAIDFVKKDHSIFRVDKETGEILPPNTWAGYGLMSPSGYDPLAVQDYTNAYNFDLNGSSDGGTSRYSELHRIDAEALGKYNVKYLFAIKRNEIEELGGDRLSYKIDQSDWTRVFDTESVAVLQNLKYKERARLINSDGTDANGSAIIVNYENNKVFVEFENIDGEKLLLADSYYPGWKATINGKPTKISDEIKPFRTVDIRGINKGEVIFEYKPLSFILGLYICIFSIMVWILLLFFVAKRNGEKIS